MPRISFHLVAIFIRGEPLSSVPFLRPDELSVRGAERALTAARDSGVGQPGERVTLGAGGSSPGATKTDLMRILTL